MSSYSTLGDPNGCHPSNIYDSENKKPEHKKSKSKKGKNETKTKKESIKEEIIVTKDVSKPRVVHRDHVNHKGQTNHKEQQNHKDQNAPKYCDVFPEKCTYEQMYNISMGDCEDVCGDGEDVCGDGVDTDGGDVVGQQSVEDEWVPLGEIKPYNVSIPITIQICMEGTTEEIMSGTWSRKYVVDDYHHKYERVRKDLERAGKDVTKLTQEELNNKIKSVLTKVKGGHVVAYKNSSLVKMACNSNVLDRTCSCHNDWVAIGIPRTGNNWVTVNLPLNVHRVKAWDEKKDDVCKGLKDLMFDDLEGHFEHSGDKNATKNHSMGVNSIMHKFIMNSRLFSPEETQDIIPENQNAKKIHLAGELKNKFISKIEKARSELPIYSSPIIFDFFRPGVDVENRNEVLKTLHASCYDNEKQEYNGVLVQEFLQRPCSVELIVILDAQFL